MAGHTENSVVINAARDLVWRITNDVAAWPELFSEYAAVQILRTTGNTVRFRLTMRPDERGRVWQWVSERTADPRTYTVHAHRVEPGPFEYMNIRWEFTEENGATLMRWTQDFQLRPDAPLNDAAMADRINRNSAREMRRIKALIEAVADRDRRASTASQPGQRQQRREQAQTWRS
ncbi:SRPBCC family protein [Phytohabitans sp. ZYX-F-186]|uniref:SRPBCC family protein n=1 Tax=Phytohabitans maris TaxID=3071409 RepID=A0ABU0ZMB2_9ACTN|nr:SRPBCC family protein [Phytohabitans sp. ZYX-F-186]MDQ7907415.1 SRPBCC family protein [Phytohabitans sp. ZYX-F-186]